MLASSGIIAGRDKGIIIKGLKVMGLIVFLVVIVALFWNHNTSTHAAQGATLNACLERCTYSSIQRAIDNANSGDTINAAAGTYNENVEISKSVSLKGAGLTVTELVGRAGAPVVFVDGDIVASISGMTISGGSAQLGGGIYNDGTLSLTSDSIDHNKANHGGGIYNYGTLTMTNTRVHDNIATTDVGGGIFNDGKLTMTGGSIDHNKGEGGAGVFNSGILTMTKVPITSNNAPGWGGGAFWNTNLLVLNGCTVSGNTALGTDKIKQTPGHEGDPLGLAGGIWNDDGTAKITNTIITGNKANVGAGVYTDGDTGHDSASMTLTGSSVDHNTANMYAGGIYNWGPLTLNSSSVSYNIASTLGGGIFNDGMGKLIMKSGSVDHNSANNGGGICNYGTLTGNTDLAHNNSPNDISSQ